MKLRFFQYKQGIFKIKKILSTLAPKSLKDIFRNTLLDIKLKKIFYFSNPEMPYYVFNFAPIILFYIPHIPFGEEFFSYLLKNKKAYFFRIIWKNANTDAKIQAIFKEWPRWKKRFPQHEIIYLCNTHFQYESLGKYNIPRLFCNQNAFCDEKIYTLLPNKNKKFDAIYNARMADFKRHYLAQNIRSLALIDNGYREGNDECFKKTKKLLKNATWLNQINKKYTFLASSEVAKFYNQAKVGLCLSKEEGAMYASMEYLLCGLPIVSTQSIGGRDIFFDEEYVKIVNDTADDVARGVQELIDLNIDSQYIRENTLKKIQTHREKFITKVQDIYDKENVNKDFRENFNNIFIDKMLRNEKIKNIKNYTIEKIGSSIESRK